MAVPPSTPMLCAGRLHQCTACLVCMPNCISRRMRVQRSASSRPHRGLIERNGPHDMNQLLNSSPHHCLLTPARTPGRDAPQYTRLEELRLSTPHLATAGFEQAADELQHIRAQQRPAVNKYIHCRGSLSC